MWWVIWLGLIIFALTLWAASLWAMIRGGRQLVSEGREATDRLTADFSTPVNFTVPVNIFASPQRLEEVSAAKDTRAQLRREKRSQNVIKQAARWESLGLIGPANLEKWRS